MTLDDLPRVDSFFGTDLKTGSIVIAALGIVHPLSYGCSFFMPLSFLMMTIWILIAFYFSACILLLYGINKADVTLMSVWIWYSIIFVSIMLVLMVLLAVVFTSRGQKSRVCIVIFGIIWYILNIYFILVVNGHRKDLMNAYTYDEEVMNEYHKNVLIMNSVTLKVVSLLDCHNTHPGLEEPVPDPTIRQTVVVCRLLLFLQQMYNFSISYEIGAFGIEHGAAEDRILERLRNGSVDVYTRAMSLREEILDYGYPVHEVYKWKFGFLLRRADFGLFGSFFKDPFEQPVWFTIYTFTIFVIVVFYLLCVFERRVVKCDDPDECSIAHETVVVLASICQSNVPISPILTSRRMAYVTYFLFNFVMYTFYTSNLLYHLVNVRKNNMDVDALIQSDYKCLILNSSIRNIFGVNLGHQFENLEKNKFQTIEYLNPTPALEAIKRGDTAVLSDFLSLYPMIKETFEDEEICQLVEIDVFTNLQKYMWISNKCPLKQEFKIGVLRALESGLLRRITSIREPSPPGCVSAAHVRAHLKHIMAPLASLLSTCGVALIILMAERKYANRQTLPYIE